MLSFQKVATWDTHLSQVAEVRRNYDPTSMTWRGVFEVDGYGQAHFQNENEHKNRDLSCSKE